jgi:hypothetical protein
MAYGFPLKKPGSRWSPSLHYYSEPQDLLESHERITLVAASQSVNGLLQQLHFPRPTFGGAKKVARGESRDNMHKL